MQVIVLKVRAKYPQGGKFGNHSCYSMSYGLEKVQKYCDKLSYLYRGDTEYKVEIEEGDIQKQSWNHKYQIKLKDSIGLMELIE